MPAKRYNPPVQGAARPETHVQFRLPPEANIALNAAADAAGRSRNITAKLMMVELLAPKTHAAMVADLREHPDRRRIDTPH